YVMARKGQTGEINKSDEIRKLLMANPSISASECVSTLAARGIKATPNLYYFVKGKIRGRKSRRRKLQRKVANVMGSNGAPAQTTDVLGTIKKVKAMATEVGGLGKLAALLEALSI